MSLTSMHPISACAGVPHSGEIPYVWGWPLLQLSEDVRRDIVMLFDIVPWNDLDYEYAEFTMDLFSNFAKYLCVTSVINEKYANITLEPTHCSRIR